MTFANEARGVPGPWTSREPHNEALNTVHHGSTRPSRKVGLLTDENACAQCLPLIFSFDEQHDDAADDDMRARLIDGRRTGVTMVKGDHCPDRPGNLETRLALIHLFH